MCPVEEGRGFCSEKGLSLLHHPEAEKELAFRMGRGFLFLRGSRGCHMVLEDAAMRYKVPPTRLLKPVMGSCTASTWI